MLDISKNLEFASNTAFPGTTAYKLGNTIDLSKTGRDIGAGKDVWLVFKTGTTAFTGTTTAISIDVVSSDKDPSTTWTTPAVHLSGDVFANVAGMPGGGAKSTVWKAIQLPAGQVYKRYLGLRANCATAAFSTGTFDAFITTEPNRFLSYNQGVIGA